MEALSFLSGGGIASSCKYFDIRLDDRYVVFRGNEHEAASALLRGTVVLCLVEPLTIKHIRLRLTGMSRICWHLPAAAAGTARKPCKERVFFEKTWSFREAGKGKTETLPADNYEFPFDVVLDGSLPESVEGMHDTWVTYRFKAEIGRKYARDITVRKPLRIIRTLDPSTLELSHAMSVENIWPNKIEYSISTPSKAVIFGTFVRVDFRLIPLLKGLKIGLISSQLIENHELTLNPDEPESVSNTHKSTRVVLTDDYELDPDHQLEIIDEMAEGYQFSRYLNLPKTLTRCLQDTETRGIKIRHKLKFRVQLHNPDGHTSELRATLPVSIFISPHLAIDDNHNLVDQTPQAAQQALDDLTQQAPPLYGEHQFDQLYSEVDMSGYLTPNPMSGAATPFGSLSRNLSAEDLPSMAAVTNGDISASALHSRLSRLHATGHSTSPDVPDSHSSDGTAPPQGHSSADYFSQYSRSHSQSPDGRSPSGSQRNSEEHDRQLSGTATPYYPQAFEVETLSRVPSYSTAVRTGVPPQYCDDLPDYDSAVGNTPPAMTPPRSPQQAHLRTGHRPQVPSSLSEPYRPFTNHDDVERRLLQARER
ncbi:hypothetical protein VTN49DRAFT_6631 [Thermomyces lanuginosus]|uniref:uncharacterized protein n=1 Tax=Thermomyces lanuginosus TaxID=5541 RepID=UPI00374443EF